MSEGDVNVKFMQVSGQEVLAVPIARLAMEAGIEYLRAAGYPRPTEAQLREISQVTTRAALEMARTIDDPSTASAGEIIGAARKLGPDVVRTVLGPPPAVN